MPAWLWPWIAIAVFVGASYVYSWWRTREQLRVDERRKPAESRASSPSLPQEAVASRAEPARSLKALTELPSLALPSVPAVGEEDEEVEATHVGVVKHFLQPPVKLMVVGPAAEAAEPEASDSYLLVSASAQTDRGLRRKRNEDSLLALPEEGVFVVADGMGGYAGGEVASRLAVETMEAAFRSGLFEGEHHAEMPPAASELARAIQMANGAILEKAQAEPSLGGMGTTVCACRFSPSKRRMYVGHVGDSRLYRVRGALEQITRDHTLTELGVVGPTSVQLSRAVGIWPTVTIDIIVLEPQPGDTFLICSDGLTKMLSDEEILEAITATKEPGLTVERLIADANRKGGKDNITVILVTVRSSPSA